MDNLKEGSTQGFEDASTRFMRMSGKEELQVQPVGVKLVLKGQAVFHILPILTDRDNN